MVVILLASLFSYSQSFTKVIRSSKLEWNGTEFVNASTNYPTDCFLIMKDWNVTVGIYKFKTYGGYVKTIFADHICYTWKCVNANGENCLFMMKTFKPEVTTHMVYSIVYTTGVMYEFETE